MWPPDTVSTVTSILGFYQVDAVCWQAFCAAAGDPGEDLRPLSQLPPGIIIQSISATTKADGSRLTTMEASQLGLVYRASRRAVFLQAGGAPADFCDVGLWEETPPQMSRASTIVGTTTPGVGERKLKFSQVLDQSDDTEFIAEHEVEKAKWLTHYIHTTGGLPPEEEEPSLEQLSALHKKVKILNMVPFVDFSIWGPFGSKQAKAVKYRSFFLQADGSYLARELPGPSTLIQWTASFKVMRCAFVMIDICSLATLLSYETFFVRLCQQYVGAWHLLVSADEKARSTHLERLRLQLRLDRDRGIPLPYNYDASRPWDFLWRQMTDDAKFWNENVHWPALQWMSRGSKSVPKTPIEVQADALVHGGSNALHPEVERQAEGSQASSPTKARREARKKKWKAEKEELESFRKKSKGGKGAGGGGKGKSTSEGAELCYAWNNGNGDCRDVPPGSECKSRVKRLHRCTVCGSPGHPSKDCKQKKWDPGQRNFGRSWCSSAWR